MENNSIKVSVVMPIYNAYDYLRPAMDSVIDQTLREIEIICIDDGSTDHSLEIIKEYQKMDSRVRIVTENNAGVSTARNKGFVRARGEYTIFLDADDFFEPTLLETLYNRAVADELDVTVVKFDIYNDKQSRFARYLDDEHSDIFTPGAVVSKNEFPHHILQSTTGYVWNKLFRTAFLREKELVFAPELYIFEDVHFVCTALSVADRIGRIDDVLVHHRVYSDQSRTKLFRKYYAQIPVVYFKIKEFLSAHGLYIPLQRSFLNLSAGRCQKIYNLLWDDAKADFWDILHGGYADSLGWYKHEPSDFTTDELYEFIANVGLYEHKQYIKREKLGKKIKTEKISGTKLNKKMKTAHRNSKLRAFFSAMIAKFKKRK